MNHQDAIDLAIYLVDALVRKGLIPDCLDTDDETEFNFQDCITDALLKRQKPEPTVE